MGALTRQENGGSLCVAVLFFGKKNQKARLTLFAPNQHAAALVQDWRGVNRVLLLYVAAHFFVFFAFVLHAV